jgi:HNH endonuclease
MFGMAASGPSVSDIKVLFARSGDRCAFPKCGATLADGGTVLGEICHIKGAKPGAARYDPDQSPEQRHTTENLILLCPTHHTVIDADEEAYTVGRIKKMKVDHEARVTTLPDQEAERTAPLFIAETVSTVGQSGGIAANTIHNVNLSTAPGGLESRRIQAVEKLWNLVRRLENEFSDVLLIDTILVPAEINGYFERRERPDIFAGVQRYANPLAVSDIYNSLGVSEAQTERPFVSSRLWAIVHVLITLHARSAMMLTVSFKEQRYNNWRDDEPLDHLLRGVLPGATVDAAKRPEFGGLKRLVDALEGEFLREAGFTRK